MELRLDISLAGKYKSGAQIARVLTEKWLTDNMYCPVCGAPAVKAAVANAPVKDCVCENCRSQYELKSSHSTTSSFRGKVSDGAYRTMIGRITSLANPSFFFLHYDRYEVNNLVIVPKCFFTPKVIEKREPLKAGDRREGWEGCNIIMREIPESAKIPIILNGEILPKEKVVREYNRVYTLRTLSLKARGWLTDVMRLVDNSGETFSLDDIYASAPELSARHPANNNIHAKIRQQLQLLRDNGLIEFMGRGRYKKIRL